MRGPSHSPPAVRLGVRDPGARWRARARRAWARILGLLLLGTSWAGVSSAQPGAEPARPDTELDEPERDTADPAPAPHAPVEAEPKSSSGTFDAAPDPAPASTVPTTARASNPGSIGEPRSAASSSKGSVRYTLEGIEVRGNTRTRTRVVLRYVPFEAGDALDVEDPQIELTRYRLLGTGFFRDVQFSLRKGSARGLVVLVISVVERNTIIVNDVWMGLAADADNEGHARPLTAYAGLDVAETNLLGTGITLGGAVGIAQEQLALRVRFLDPAFLGSRWMTSGTLLFNDAKDFFGNAGVLYADPNQLSRQNAVVRYKRFGGAVGVGSDLSTALQLWGHYRLEAIDADFPQQASHLRGIDNVEPIDFDIIRGRSVLSALRATLQLDTRDHPFLPTRGWFVTATAELGLRPLGSDYSFQRTDVGASRWLRLPWHDHVLRLEVFGGAIAGDAPFFEQYYVGDFSDFLPSRVLGVNFDRRPPPNFLGTQIVEVRYSHFAAKVGGEYRIPLYRGSRSVFGIDLFASAGLFALASEREFQRPAPGYSGLARVPVDLTANLGFRLDTSAGGFVFAFSNVVYFLPVSGEGPAGE